MVDTRLTQEEAFERLYRAHYQAAIAFVRRRVPASLVDEIVAETFTIAWRRFDRIPTRDARAWLLGVAKNVIGTQLRSAERRDRLLKKLNSNRREFSYDIPLVLDKTSAVAESFSKLPAKDQEALALVVWDELEPRQAANVLGISATSFRVRLHRARTHLRNLIGADTENTPRPVSSKRREAYERSEG